MKKLKTFENWDDDSIAANSIEDDIISEEIADEIKEKIKPILVEIMNKYPDKFENLWEVYSFIGIIIN